MPLEDLVIDVRHLMPRRPRVVARRGRAQIETGTLHYNGPPTSLAASASQAAELAYCRFIAQWHIDQVWGYDHGHPVYGDGAMYHLIQVQSGRLYWVRDLEDCLWHCGNSTGNANSLALHLALGGAQAPTAEAWASLTQAFVVAGQQFGFRRAAVRGHREWPRSGGGPQSACPGPILTRELAAWREEKVLTPWRVWYDAANVRQGPGTTFPVALDGKAVYQLGQIFLSDGITLGQLIGGSNRWVHLANGIGFIHDSLLERV